MKEDFWYDMWHYTRPFCTIRDLYYDTKNRLFKRYDLVRTGLNKSAWWDIDSKILYGMMNMLVDYVEKEKCFEILDWDHDKEHKRVKKEIEEIYDWWKNYPNREKEIDEVLTAWHDYVYEDVMELDIFEQIKKGKKDKTSKKLLDQHCDLEKKLNDEETEMLIRIVKIRNFLWT